MTPGRRRDRDVARARRDGDRVRDGDEARQHERVDDDRLDDPEVVARARVAPLLELEAEEREDDERRRRRRRRSSRRTAARSASACRCRTAGGSSGSRRRRRAHRRSPAAGWSGDAGGTPPSADVGASARDDSRALGRQAGRVTKPGARRACRTRRRRRRDRTSSPSGVTRQRRVPGGAQLGDDRVAPVARVARGRLRPLHDDERAMAGERLAGAAKHRELGALDVDLDQRRAPGSRRGRPGRRGGRPGPRCRRCAAAGGPAAACARAASCCRSSCTGGWSRCPAASATAARTSARVGAGDAAEVALGEVGGGGDRLEGAHRATGAGGADGEPAAVGADVIDGAGRRSRPSARRRAP